MLYCFKKVKSPTSVSDGGVWLFFKLIYLFVPGHDIFCVINMPLPIHSHVNQYGLFFLACKKSCPHPPESTNHLHSFFVVSSRIPVPMHISDSCLVRLPTDRLSLLAAGHSEVRLLSCLKLGRDDLHYRRWCMIYEKNYFPPSPGID